ncbi:AAA family ATPase [Mycoplasmopsis cynos]|uniref:ATPase n=1 Tax=Mycoplasmopsis cynos TaxID=171284 RepID=A0A449AGY6_9BACT|nr:AAA family ATPase [Mycoplasmopsis cynos]VEU64271.1 ATPase [Mycoplasmopsis cynos]
MYESRNQKTMKKLSFCRSNRSGKTKTAELIAEKLFSKDKFLILNMSEYADEIKSLIDQNGTLSKQLSNNPQSIVLFDEIEKASQKNNWYTSTNIINRNICR